MRQGVGRSGPLHRNRQVRYEGRQNQQGRFDGAVTEMVESREEISDRAVPLPCHTSNLRRSGLWRRLNRSGANRVPSKHAKGLTAASYYAQLEGHWVALGPTRRRKRRTSRPP